MSDKRQNGRDPLIIALDVESVAKADRLVQILGDSARFYKVGLELFSATGMGYVQSLVDRGKDVFLDLKFHDIGETVKRAVAQVAKTRVTYLTVHGVPQIVRAAHAGRGDSNLKILAVTVLTSLDEADVKADGHCLSLRELVALRVRNAVACGADGLIGSPLEAKSIRSVAGPEPILVTPGVRSAGSDTGDQKRVATPAEAIRDGANHLVIGRQVTRAVDPVAALEQIRLEIS